MPLTQTEYGRLAVLQVLYVLYVLVALMGRLAAVAWLAAGRTFRPIRTNHGADQGEIMKCCLLSCRNNVQSESIESATRCCQEIGFTRRVTSTGFATHNYWQLLA